MAVVFDDAQSEIWAYVGGVTLTAARSIHILRRRKRRVLSLCSRWMDLRLALVAIGCHLGAMRTANSSLIANFGVEDMTSNDASRRFHLRTLSNRIDRFLTLLERNRRQPNRRERYHLVEALQHLYEGRSEEIQAALNRAEKVEPLPTHLTAQPIPSDSVTVANLREGLSAIRQQQEKD